MHVHRVKNVQEAVALAADLKRQAHYDWFRGQVQDWPLKSAYLRRESAQHEGVLQQAARFEHWVKATPGLAALAQNPDAIIAVAQHYGIPTNFIDFTTEPAIAGFFASDKRPSDPSRNSCILCLSTEDLQRFWKLMSSQYPPPEFLRLDVSDLWRLEAQAGVFLYCPYANFEHIYDLDRIIFPYTGSVSEPQRDDVYPKRKSHLEILLDQYFMNERLIEGTRYVQQQIAAGVWSSHEVVRNQPWDPDLVIAGGPPPLDSWKPDNLDPWLSPSPERYAQARSTLELRIRIDQTSIGFSQLREKVKAEIQAGVRSTSEIRRKLVRWNIQSPGAPLDGDFAEALSAAVARLWDGLRSLPYDTEDLVEGASNCVVIALAAGHVGPSDTKDIWWQAASKCFGDSIEVEFGSDDGSYARGYCATAALLSTVRDDIAAFLNPRYRDQLLGNVIGLLQAVQAPNRLFEFARLARLFARQLAPIQVLMRGRSAIFFSPARVNAFGLP